MCRAATHSESFSHSCSGDEAEADEEEQEDSYDTEQEYSEEEDYSAWEEEEEEEQEDEEVADCSSAVAEEAAGKEHEQGQGEPVRRVRPRLDPPGSPGREVWLYIMYADHEDFVLPGVQSMTIGSIKMALHKVLGILPFRQCLTLLDGFGSLVVDEPSNLQQLSDWGIEDIVHIQVQYCSAGASSSTTCAGGGASTPTTAGPDRPETMAKDAEAEKTEREREDLRAKETCQPIEYGPLQKRLGDRLAEAREKRKHTGDRCQ